MCRYLKGLFFSEVNKVAFRKQNFSKMFDFKNKRSLQFAKLIPNCDEILTSSLSRPVIKKKMVFLSYSYKMENSFSKENSKTT